MTYSLNFSVSSSLAYNLFIFQEGQLIFIIYKLEFFEFKRASVLKALD